MLHKKEHTWTSLFAASVGVLLPPIVNKQNSVKWCYVNDVNDTAHVISPLKNSTGIF